MITDDDRTLYRHQSELLSLHETRPDLYRQQMREKFPQYPASWPERGRLHDFQNYGAMADLNHAVACYSYRIDHDIAKFLESERKVPEYVVKMYDDAKNTGEEALKAAFTPTAYARIFYGLAGRNFDGARRLAQLILDTEVFEILKNRADCYFFGNVLMYTLTGSSQVWPMYEKLKKCKKGDGRAFAKIFDGLLNKDQAIAQEGIADLVKALKRQAEWVDMHIGYLNTWALGMANLCRLHGVWVDAVEPQVPADLLIPQEEVDAVLRQWPELGELPSRE